MKFNNPGLPNEPKEMQYQFPKVKVYWVGDFYYTETDADGNIVEHDILIGANGHGVKLMPRLGEALEVTQNVAEILVANARAPYPTGHPLNGQALRDGLTFDAEYAALRRDAFYSGKSISAITAEKAIGELETQKLVEELKKRGITDISAVPEEKPTKKAGRPPKSEE
jgi:hypothetical protein